MKKLILTAFVLLLSVLGWSQSNEKDNQFFLVTGFGYRVTPVDLKSQNSWATSMILYERDRQVSGLAFNMGLEYYRGNPRIGFEVSNSFRYHYLYTANQSLNLYEKKAFTTDFHFNIYKYLPLRKNSLKTGIGYSFLNTGSDYTYTETSNSMQLIGLDNFHFSSFNATIGLQVNQLSFDLVNRFTTQHRFYSQGQMYIPELRLGYSLLLKNKKRI